MIEEKPKYLNPRWVDKENHTCGVRFLLVTSITSVISMLAIQMKVLSIKILMLLWRCIHLMRLMQIPEIFMKNIC